MVELIVDDTVPYLLVHPATFYYFVSESDSRALTCPPRAISL